MNGNRGLEKGQREGSPAGEQSGSGSGSAMDAMLRQRRGDENEPAEKEDEAEHAAAKNAQRPGSR